MTPQEVADLLGVSAQTIKNWEEIGILKSFKGGLRSKFFSRTFIEKFVSELDNLNKGEKLLKDRIVATNKLLADYNHFMQDFSQRNHSAIHRLATTISEFLFFTTEMYNEDLSETDKQIIRKIAGFKSSYEIANDFGCSTQRIQQLYDIVEKHISELAPMQSRYLHLLAENKRLQDENKQLLDKIIAEKVAEEESNSIVDVKTKPITAFGFSNRLLHILGKHKIKYMHDLVSFDPRKFWITRNFGAKCAQEIEIVLNKYNLKFENAPQGVYTKFGTKDFKDKSLRKEIDYALSV